MFSNYVRITKAVSEGGLKDLDSPPRNFSNHGIETYFEKKPMLTTILDLTLFYQLKMHVHCLSAQST